MSTGEVVVWCVGMVCVTILVGITILAIMFRPEIKKESAEK